MSRSLIVPLACLLVFACLLGCQPDNTPVLPEKPVPRPANFAAGSPGSPGEGKARGRGRGRGRQKNWQIPNASDQPTDETQSDETGNNQTGNTEAGDDNSENESPVNEAPVNEAPGDEPARNPEVEQPQSGDNDASTQAAESGEPTDDQSGANPR